MLKTMICTAALLAYLLVEAEAASLDIVPSGTTDDAFYSTTGDYGTTDDAFYSTTEVSADR